MDKFCEDCVHNEVCQYYAIPPHKDRCNDKDTLDDLIPRGEWIFQYRFLDEDIYKCSNCGRLISIPICDNSALSEHKFCQECGAKMKK